MFFNRLGLGAGCSDATDLVPVPTLKDKKCIEISCGSAASFAVLDNGIINIFFGYNSNINLIPDFFLKEKFMLGEWVVHINSALDQKKMKMNQFCYVANS